jgi:phosphate:Na+ symporter
MRYISLNHQNLNTFASLKILRFLILACITGICFLASPAIASDAMPQGNSPDWLQVGLGLFGGLAIFLAGLQSLSEGMKKAAGQAMTTVLAKLTTNRFSGALTGAFVTGVLNSSTVTTLLVVGFISSGMMTLSQSVGVIMGANIGSTVTAQLLAFDLAAYSLGPVAIGFFMLFSAKQDSIKYYGMMIMGIGLVFYGMGLMGDAMTPLRTYEPFLEILKNLERPLAGILAGAIFTAIVQSSAATVGIAIAMATEGLLGLSAGIALALGANIGTAVTTAIMGVLSSKSTDAVRASVVHVAFNIVGVLIWLPFIWLLVDIAVWISPSTEGLTGSEKMAADVPRQIANANTFFNVMNTILFIGFTSWFARLAAKLVPERVTPDTVLIEPEYLHTSALAATPMALQQARLEIARVGTLATEMLRDFVPAFRERDMDKLNYLIRKDDQIDLLEAEILQYLGKIRQSSLTSQESLELQNLMIATDNFENLADVIETDLVSLAHKAYKLNLNSSTETMQMMKEMYDKVLESVELTVTSIRNKDQNAAQAVISMKDQIRDHSEQLLSRKVNRLISEDPAYIELVRLEMSFVDQMRRIYTLTKRIAKIGLPSAIAENA